MVEEVNVNLGPNHVLLDPNFDGYKLNLERLAPISKDITCPVYHADLSQVTSYNESKQLMLFNCLFEDRFSFEKVYYIDQKLKVHEFYLVFGEFHDNIVAEVFVSITSTVAYYPAISFSSKNLAVIYNGQSVITFFDTGDRSSSETNEVQKWKLIGTYDCETSLSLFYSIGNAVPGNEERFDFTVVTAESIPMNEEEGFGDQSPKVELIVRKLIIDMVNQNAAKPMGKVQFNGKEYPETAFLNKDGTLLQIVGVREFKPNNDISNAKNAVRKDLKIICSQNEKFLKVDILDITTEENDLQVKITSNVLKCFDKKEEKLIIESELFFEVVADRCNWSLDTDSKVLSVMLEKKEQDLLWRQLFTCKESQHSVAMKDGDRASENDGGEECENKPYNIEELESCDDFTSTEKSKWQMFRLNWTHSEDREEAEEKKLTCLAMPVFTANLHSHEILFSRVLNCGDVPALCLRHDVDALLWETTISNVVNDDSKPPSPWQHAMTFNALGYVQASKRERKFISCAPSGKYAAIAECTRRVYVYMQPEAIESSLVNRKTGRKVPKIAKQFVITLDSHEPITGIVCLNEHLFISLSSEIVVYSII